MIFDFFKIIIKLINSAISFNFSSLFSIIITPFVKDVIILIMIELQFKRKLRRCESGEMTFLERNITKLRITKEIEVILSENNIGINDFEEIVLQIRTDYKNNPLDSKNIKRKYIVYNFTYIAIIIVFLLIVFLEFFQKI